MNAKGFLLTSAACFVGVAAALQVSHMTHREAESNAFGSFVPRAMPTVRPALAEVGAPAFDFTAAAQKASPSVVSIDRYERTPTMMGDLSPEQETGTGSGVIVSADGTIVTNNHVVKGIDPSTGRVMVRLADKRALPAKILGTDPRSDLAVIKIEAKDLQPIELAASDAVRVGQWVLAVGNPLGFENTVSVGVVSSLKRDLPVEDSNLVGAIQTDAAINPGNSGGALCDAQGRLIGINSAIASRSGGSVGIGFAIPVDRVKKIVGDIVKDGYAHYAGLGVSYQPVPVPLSDPRYRQYLERTQNLTNLPDSGVLIDSATGAAQAAGISGGDILMKIGDEKLETPLDLNRTIMDRKAGEKIQVQYWSKGQTRTTTVTLQELPRQL